MRCQVLAAGALVTLLLTMGAYGQPLEADANDLEGLLRTLRAATAKESPLIYQTDGGFVRFIGAPPGGRIESGTAAKAGAESVAKEFVEAHRGAFGLVSERTSIRTQSVSPAGARSVVRLEQTYGALPVFGAQVLVQVNADGSVRLVNSDIAIDLRALDSGAVSVTPRIDAAAASARAREYTALRSENHEAADLTVIEGPELMVYAPAVGDEDGAVRLVWRTVVEGKGVPPVLEVVLVDAHSGAEALSYSQIHEGRRRLIFDHQNLLYTPTQPVRIEGQAPTDIKDVDNVYDYLGHVYDFFLSHHNWDNFDGGLETPPSGFQFMPIRAFVRYPFDNAAFSPNGTNSRFIIGTDYDVDDVVAHEFTHGVTEYTSRLVYQGFSGAINESFSDIWGEFVDLTNSAGIDTSEVRWLMGEDTPDGAIRNMADPTEFGDPDRLGSPLLIDPSSGFDNGGVHINSGIGNKLCYLLTDGDEFNAQKVEGMGIDTVADMFWECQNILTPRANYYDLYFALMAGSVNLEMPFETRLNILAACLGVEIVPPGQSAAFRAVAVNTSEGLPAVALAWEVPDPSALEEPMVVRSQSGYVLIPSEGTVVFDGVESHFLDEDVVPGVEYFYTLVQDYTEEGIVISFASAIAGSPPIDYMTEAFDSEDPIDLSNTQLTFTPVGAPQAPLGTPTRATGFERYELTRVRNVLQLPTPYQDAEGGAIQLTFFQDGYLWYTLENPVHFMGVPYRTIFVSSNGYISFSPISRFDINNFPSLAAHFAVSRISFLFADLEPKIGGQVWARDLKDRFVLTFDQVPEWTFFSFPGPETNTVQVELFHSGQIRITYQQLHVRDAVVGISDGRGAPFDPADLFDNVLSVPDTSDLSAAPLSLSRLRIEPIASQTVEAGELVQFDFHATARAGAGIPQLTAAWTEELPATYADLGNGSGRFEWPTTIFDEGVYTVRIAAALGQEYAFQDVRINVGETIVEPAAIDLELATGTPLEDPTQDRNIAPGVPLFASYTYTHPQMDPNDPFDMNSEGMSLLYWRRNSAVVPGFTNRVSVPADRVRAGDAWSFSVVPITASAIIGPEAFSPTVFVNAAPDLLSITPNFGEVNGGDRVTITGSRLSGPLSVTFGGIKADQVFSLGDSKLEVITPLHVAETVDVVVKTAKGFGTLKNAFTFTPDAAKVPNPDVNGDGVVDALDVQTVINAILSQAKSQLNADVNRDGAINAADMQAVINAAIYR